MHFCFNSFSSKRGRPKLDAKEQKIIRREEEADLLYSLFYLNKINKKQLSSANFYEQLYKKYQKSIESPSNNTSSVIRVVDRNAGAKNHQEGTDAIVHEQWTNLKKFLFDYNCEEITYKVLTEGKISKNDLLNPIRVNQNLLEDFRNALDRISDYRNNLSKKFEFEQKKPQIIKYLKVLKA
jgi:MOSC domain-containing protein YiiM